VNRTKKRLIKWTEVFACEEMVGKPVKKSGNVIGKIVDIAPGTVTAELPEKVFKQVFSPILNSSLGVRNHDPSNRSKSKSN